MKKLGDLVLIMFCSASGSGGDLRYSDELSLFAWLISHQPAVLFSHNKPATSNRPTVLFSQNKPAPAISHQPTEQAARPETPSLIGT
jgi:hypothetical protein